MEKEGGVLLPLDEKSNLHKVCLVQICCKYQLSKGFTHFVQIWQAPLLQRVWVIVECRG